MTTLPPHHAYWALMPVDDDDPSSHWADERLVLVVVDCRGVPEVGPAISPGSSLRCPTCQHAAIALQDLPLWLAEWLGAWLHERRTRDDREPGAA